MGFPIITDDMIASITKALAERLYKNDSPNWVEELNKKAKMELPFLLNKAPELDDEDKKKVLFWTMSPWSYTVIDCILATALKLRGHDTLMIVCDGLDFCELDQCTGKVSDHGKYCKNCVKQTLKYINAFGLEWKPLSLFATQRLFNDGKDLIESTNIDALRSLVIDGIRIGDLAQINTGYYQGIPGTLWPLLNKDVFKSACITGFVLTKASGNIIKSEKPNIVITTGGRTIIWAPLFELAKINSLGTVNWEDYSVHPNGFIFSHNQPAVRGYLSDVWLTEKNKELTKIQRNELKELFSAWKKSEATPYQYYKEPEESVNIIYKKLGLQQGKRIVAIFPNILREDNTVQGNAAFTNQIEWLTSIIKYSNNDKNTYYIIRAHPAEDKLPSAYILNRLTDVLMKVNQSIPDNLKFIPPESNISSYKLGEISDAIMVWTGTLGLEFSMMGRRVIVAGEPGYRGKGFTMDLINESNIKKSIEYASTNKVLSTNEIMLAEHYAYLLRFRTLVRFPFHTGHKDRRFIIQSFDELTPGGNQVIEKLCDCIINNKPFIDICV